MTKKAECLVERIHNSDEFFGKIKGLRNFIESFAHSALPIEFILEKIEGNGYFLWVAHTPKRTPLGYLFCDPEVKHDWRKLQNKGFYLLEREAKGNRIDVNYALVFAAAWQALRLKKRQMYEEINIRHLPALQSSKAVGFKEIGRIYRGRKEEYLLMRKQVG